MAQYEKNTKEFYEELNGVCRPERLLEIAKRGIFLLEPLFRYERIREHEYVVYISALARQYFMICNEKQYMAFLKNINNVKIFNEFVELSRFDYCRLVIINEFFLSRLMEETNEFLLMTILESYDTNYLLRFLNKFEYIPDPIYSLFNKKDKSTFFDFINFFYFGVNSCLFSYEPTTLKRLDKTNFQEMATMIGKSGYDIQMLNYLVELLEYHHQILPVSDISFFRVPLNFPVNALQYYTHKIYQSNLLQFQYSNKYVEKFFNTVFTDTYFNRVLTWEQRNSNLFFFCNKDSNMFKRYDIDISNFSGSYTIENQEEYQFQKELRRISNHLDTMEINEKEEEKEENIDEDDEIQILNQYDKIDQLLKNPETIFSLREDLEKLSDPILKLNLTYICYIISLIHHQLNDFIIMLFTKILNETFRVHYKKQKLYLYCDFNSEQEMKLCQILNNIPHDIFRSYFLFKEKNVNYILK